MGKAHSSILFSSMVGTDGLSQLLLVDILLLRTTRESERLRRTHAVARNPTNGTEARVETLKRLLVGQFRQKEFARASLISITAPSQYGRVIVHATALSESSYTWIARRCQSYGARDTGVYAVGERYRRNKAALRSVEPSLSRSYDVIVVDRKTGCDSFSQCSDYGSVC